MLSKKLVTIFFIFEILHQIYKFIFNTNQTQARAFSNKLYCFQPAEVFVLYFISFFHNLYFFFQFPLIDLKPLIAFVLQQVFTPLYFTTFFSCDIFIIIFQAPLIDPLTLISWVHVINHYHPDLPDGASSE